MHTHTDPSSPGSAAVRLPVLRHSCPALTYSQMRDVSRESAINVCSFAAQLQHECALKYTKHCSAQEEADEIDI